MNAVQQMMVKAELFEATKTAIGLALSAQQQNAVSAKLAASQNSFLEWSGTDAGKAAIRALVDAFITPAAVAKP